MELLLLGTAAAEGWPAAFCECPHCEEARRRGGANLRLRSGALIDDDIKIDFGPDTVAHMQKCGRSLARMRTLIFTHQHNDHISPAELHRVLPPYTQTPPEKPIALYGNSQVLSLVEAQFKPVGKNTARKLEETYTLHLMEPLKPLTTSDGDEILPMPADHVEGALVLRITRSPQRGGKTLFYGHDSGFYPQETLDALEAGPKLDIALFDSTGGGLDTANRGHMDCDGVIQMVEELRKRGAITENTRAIATHFSHNGGLLHEELVQKYLPHRIEVAYDGMLVGV